MDTQALLSRLDPNAGYADWLLIGRALFAAGELFETWDAWSKGSEKYPRNHAIDVWRGFASLPALPPYYLSEIATARDSDSLAVKTFPQLIGQPGIQYAAVSSSHLTAVLREKYSISIKGRQVARLIMSLGYMYYGSLRWDGKVCSVWTRQGMKYWPARHEVVRRLLSDNGA